ncbi:MAG: GTPase Era [Thiotrichales bacterium]
MSGQTSCGQAVIVGRPNVGKSTLMNHILGVHLAATTPKPQTTRNRILGIHTDQTHQILFIDTPGIHKNARRLLNQRLNKTAVASLAGADVLVFLIEAGQWRDEDERVLAHLKESRAPVVLVVNKIDLVKPRDALLPFLEKVGSKHSFAEIIPMSAFDERDIGHLLSSLKHYIPEREFEFSEDEMTDRSMRFVAAELVREQLMIRLGAELPYSLAVEIEYYRESEKGVDIGAIIFVERDSQKRIVIGKAGENLKAVGIEARKRISGIISQPVHLKLWVKVKTGWGDNPGLVDRFSLDHDKP